MTINERTGVLTADQRVTLLGMFCAALDGRDMRPYILSMDGDLCITAHNILKVMDDKLKAQWTLMGAPADRDIL